jgi:hypothetical protein
MVWQKGTNAFGGVVANLVEVYGDNKISPCQLLQQNKKLSSIDC